MLGRLEDYGFRVQPWRPHVPLSDDQLDFFISYAVAFAVFGLIARWYLWPALRDRPARTALPQMLPYASFQVNGLMFLMPGLVSTQLPKAFAIPTAYGDLMAAVLVLLILWPVRTGNADPASMIWRFYIVDPLASGLDL